ncbi:MAG: DUF433 domain-containing protein [Pyrinomonadaceae bacterium]
MPLQRDPLPFSVDPEIMSGTPVFPGTRVPINALLNNLAAGVTLEEFLDNFPTVSEPQALSLLKVFNDDYYDSDIAAFFTSKRVQLPDFIFDACLLDRQWESSVGIQCPLRERRTVTHQYLSGCYAWIQLGENSADVCEVMYVGKAARLRNRLGAHFLHAKFLDLWWEEMNKLNRSYIPFVAVWLTKNRAALESELLKRLTPRFNRRRE